MKHSARIYPGAQILHAVLLGAILLFSTTPAFSQSPSSVVRKALASLLDPPTGTDALEKSSKRISAALAAYIQANKPADWNQREVPDSLDNISKLESRIKQLDSAETIDAFMRHTVEHLIRYPESPTFAQRLWKLSAITELTEREGKSRLLIKPFLPALLSACALLPPDNPFNIEGKFLSARHYRQLGQPLKEEALFRDLLQRPRLSREAKYTVNKLLGDFLESQGRFNEAINIYMNTGKELEGLPQSIDMKLRGALLQLENGNRDVALEILRSLSSTPQPLLKLTAAPDMTETIIRLSGDTTSLTDYWKNSDHWWTQWLTLRTKLGLNRPDQEKRIPDLNEISNFEQKIAVAVAARNDAQFYDLLDLLMHALRWCPSLIEQAGPSLCFFAPRVNPDHQLHICEFTINLCKNFGEKDSDQRRFATLYQTICYSDTNQHKAAVRLIETFRGKNTRKDSLSETITRLWAHLAIDGHTDINGPRKALEKLLDGPTPAFNRPQSVLYLARIYRFLKLQEEEKSLLNIELKHDDVRNENSVAAILSSRYRELTQDKAVNAKLAAAATEWSNMHAPVWLNFALPEGLNDPRIKDLPLSNALTNPAASKMSPEEAIKLQILAAGNQDTEFGIRSRSFYAAFAVIYSGSPTHSAARKMLRDILRDDRFPEQLQEIILAYSLEEALSRHRKRDITSAITHPIFSKSNDRIKASRESYARFANTDLDTKEGIEDCYKELIAKPVTQSSLTVITALFERLLLIGAQKEAQGIASGMASWKMNPNITAGRDALQAAFQKNLERASGNILFSREMQSLIRDGFNNSTPDVITQAADYRREIDLKRLPEKEAFSLLLQRATGGSILESDPQFWMNLAELMPRGEDQVEFSFRLVEILLTSNIQDLEKSYAIFSTPSIIDTDNPKLLKRLLKLFERHRNISGEPNSHAAMRIVETQSRDFRQGIRVNLDDAWKDLDHPALTRLLTSSKLSQFMAHRDNDALRKELEAIPEEELLSPGLIDISWPALIMAGMENKAGQADSIISNLLPSLIAGAARKLDFHSIRLVYTAAKRLKSPHIIPKNWLDCLDGQIQSERDRYSLRIIDAEFREDWPALLEWSTRAVTEYPTYYNYYRHHGIALAKAGRKEEAIRSLEIYTKYSHDEMHWHAAAQLLQEIGN